jgi:hypothetical protein
MVGEFWYYLGIGRAPTLLSLSMHSGGESEQLFSEVQARPEVLC